MKGPPIDEVVYNFMFPKPKSTDPQNFQNLLQRQLVPEVRLETQAFYGGLDTQEAKYPGLDYAYEPHRVRLRRYPWHRRLFRAMDNLRLTASEIAGLTKWEGTRWAKERFERERNITIPDTTGSEIEDWVEPELRVPTIHAQRANVEHMQDIQEEGEEDDEDNDMGEDVDDSDAEIPSIGNELNERLRVAVAMREAGHTSTVMDEEYEQWLKEAIEDGRLPQLPSDLGLSPNAYVPGTRPIPHISVRYLNAGRLGQWQQIPESLHSFVRHHLERIEAESSLPPTQTNSPSSDATLTLTPNARHLPSSVSGPPYDRPARVPTHSSPSRDHRSHYSSPDWRPIRSSLSLNAPLRRRREQDSNA